MSTGTIRMICPNLRCRAILSVPATARGRKVRCRNCGQKVTVPATAGKPAPQTAPVVAPDDDESTDSEKQ